MGYKITNRHASKTFTIPPIYGGGSLPPGASITILDTAYNVNLAFGDANSGASTDPLDFAFSRGDSSSIMPANTTTVNRRALPDANDLGVWAFDGASPFPNSANVVRPASYFAAVYKQAMLL